ncbi:MAG: DUF370 domain-containing protein [Bacillota bacterium]|nr:DUF370 domain-containing protein [Bacillota bacterium]
MTVWARDLVLILDAACARGSPDFRRMVEAHRRRGRLVQAQAQAPKSYVLTAEGVLYASVLSSAALRARLERGVRGAV